MDKREKIIQVIYSVMDEEINSLPSRKEPLKKSEDTVLFGDSDGLDSLELISLFVGVEEKIGNAFNTEIALAVMSDGTVQTLTDYIITLLEAD